MGFQLSRPSNRILYELANHKLLNIYTQIKNGKRGTKRNTFLILHLEIILALFYTDPNNGKLGKQFTLKIFVYAL